MCACGNQIKGHIAKGSLTFGKAWPCTPMLFAGKVTVDRDERNTSRTRLECDFAIFWPSTNRWSGFLPPYVFNVFLLSDEVHQSRIRDSKIQDRCVGRFLSRFRPLALGHHLPLRMVNPSHQLMEGGQFMIFLRFSGIQFFGVQMAMAARIPSGKRLHHYGSNHIFWWEKPCYFYGNFP